MKMLLPMLLGCAFAAPWIDVSFAKISESVTIKKIPQFLHITDMHLDTFYVEGSSFESNCHRNLTVPNGAGKYGSPESGCDSPMALINKTFDYMRENIAVDFVIWTGDNSRHDTDAKRKSSDETMLQNQILTDKMHNAFNNVPIIPSIGKSN
jgi:endopolyphosphatase